MVADAPHLGSDRAVAPGENFGERLAGAARAQVGTLVIYNDKYIPIAYPMGDVPPMFGVCTDVVVRAFRKAGVDLQVAVHEDMKKEFSAYPRKWGRRSPDPNIDHRRVPNLMTFFERRNWPETA